MKKETLEEATDRLQKDKYGIFISKDIDVKGQLVIDTAKAAFKSGMIEGAEWQQERMYSEEEVKNIVEEVRWQVPATGNPREFTKNFDKWFEQFKKKQL